MKKFISLLFTLMLSASLTLPAAAAGLTFRDVPPEHWAHTAITDMAARGLLEGVTEPDANGIGLFNPTGSMNRSHFVVVTARYIDSKTLTSLPAGEHWYSAAYQLLISHSILLPGELDGGILDKPITREEMALILSRVAASEGKVPEKLIDESAIPDYSEITPAYQNGVKIAYSLGILTGVDTQGTFHPHGVLNRAQASTVFYRLLGVPVNSDIPKPPAPTIPEITDVPSPMKATEISNLASPAVFYIEVSDKSGTPFATGSGFFIDKNGTGVTNYHVIEGAYSAKLTTPDGKIYEIGKVLYYDTSRDLVVFKTEGIIGDVPFLKLADPNSIKNGEKAYAIGSPRGLQNSITDGLVSNANRILPGESLSYIQTSAPISPGSSGGPLLNEQAQVIGVNTAGFSDAQNLNLAIPVKDILNIDYKTSPRKTLAQIAEETLSSEPSVPVVPQQPIVISAPQNLQVVGQDANAVYIQWDYVPNADYYHVYSRLQGESDFWYENDTVYPGPMRFYWESNYSLRYFDLTPGTTYEIVVTSVSNGVESANSNVLTFTFWGSTETSPQIPFYSDAWWVPDFGALTGIQPYYWNNSGNSAFYAYDTLFITSDTYTLYYELLASLGYEYDPVTSTQLANNGAFYVPLVFYIPGTGFSIITDIDPNLNCFIVMSPL